MMSFFAELLNNLMDLETLISIFAIIIGSIIVIKVGELIIKRLEKKYKLNSTAHYLFKDLLKYSVIIIAITWILQLIGINIQNIIISLGIVGVAVGFASKDIVSNFLSGIFLVTDKDLEVGEVIEVKGTKGTIKKIGFRNTHIINQDNHKITIPNSVLSTEIHKQFKHKEDYRIRLKVILPIEIDLFEFKEELENRIMKNDWIDQNKKMSFEGLDYCEEGTNVLISFWVKNYKDLIPGKLTIMNEANKIIKQMTQT